MPASVFKRICAVLLAGAVAGCADIHLTQRDDEAIVRMGEFNSIKDNRPATVAQLAGYYVPYALLSTRAYGTATEVGERWTQLVTRPDGRPTPIARDVRLWMADWTPLWHVEGPLKCPDARAAQGRCTTTVGGLAYQTWARRDCSEVVVAFRGTNFREWNDWITNFHWLTRALPVFDQYDQVQVHAANIVDLMRSACRGRKSVRLTAVGHSLGGGLAQHISYASTEVSRVYAFDPSMVTGIYSVDISRRFDGREIEIDRVYEHGELLAYFRYFIRQFIPPTACRPQIRNVRVDLLKGTAIDQHGMGEITTKLVALAGSPQQWAARRDKYRLPAGPEGGARCGRAAS